MEFTCWNCSNEIEVDSAYLNVEMECPHCGKNFIIPKRKKHRSIKWANPYRKTTSIPIGEYVFEKSYPLDLESLEYLTSAKRGNNWGLLIFLWGSATLGIVPLVVLIIYFFKPRPKPPLRGYEAKAYIDVEIQHLVITEPRDGRRVPIDLIPIDLLKMIYVSGQGGSEGFPETAHFYYGAERIGEFPNSQKNVDRINVQITNAKN